MRLLRMRFARHLLGLLRIEQGDEPSSQHEARLEGVTHPPYT
jgi:hypothetical protein